MVRTRYSGSKMKIHLQILSLFGKRLVLVVEGFQCKSLDI